LVAELTEQLEKIKLEVENLKKISADNSASVVLPSPISLSNIPNADTTALPSTDIPAPLMEIPIPPMMDDISLPSPVDSGIPPPPIMDAPTFSFSSTPKPTKKAIKPSVPMKQLHWNRILLESSSSRKESIWDNISETDIDKKEIEILFGRATKSSSTTEEPKEKLATKKVISVLDPKRSNGIAIMSSKLPSEDKLILSINSLDGSQLSKDIIKSLLSNLPTEEEISTIKSNEDPDVIFDKPERILLVLSSIPFLFERLKCWSFKLEFNELTGHIQQPIDAIMNGIRQTKESEGLKTILATILYVGNYLNGGTSKGQADGFEIDALGKMTMIKDSSNKMTLLDYVVKIVKNNYADSLTKLPSVKVIDESTRVSFEEVSKDLQSLEKNFINSKQMVVTLLKNGGPTLEVFNQIMPPFFDEAEKTIKKLQNRFKEASDSFVLLLEHFGISEEKIKSNDPHTFFGILKDFLNSFNKSLAELQAPPKITRPIGQKVGVGSDPIAALANAIKLGQNPKMSPKPKT